MSRVAKFELPEDCSGKSEECQNEMGEYLLEMKEVDRKQKGGVKRRKVATQGKLMNIKGKRDKNLDRHGDKSKRKRGTGEGRKRGRREEGKNGKEKKGRKGTRGKEGKGRSKKGNDDEEEAKYSREHARLRQNNGKAVGRGGTGRDGARTGWNGSSGSGEKSSGGRGGAGRQKEAASRSLSY